jgi:hypothetical protein
MTPNDSDDHDDALAGINLDIWRVPPPAPLDRAALLGRALAPHAMRPRRRRLAWVLAGIVLANVAVAALVVILARPAATPHTVSVLPAGGDALSREMEQQIHDLDRKIKQLEKERGDAIYDPAPTDIEAAHARLLQLEKEQQEIRARIKTIREGSGGSAAEVHSSRELPGDSQHTDVEPKPAPAGSCDEVSCVLSNYDGACCAKLRAAGQGSADIPETLDRVAISNAIASVKAKVFACGEKSAAHGKVKLHVTVAPSGSATKVEVDATPDAALGTCVADAVKGAVFPRTRTGGSFSYPFVF